MRKLRIALILLALGLSACGGATTPTSPGATAGLETTIEPVATTGLDTTTGPAITPEAQATTEAATQTLPTSATEPTTMAEGAPTATTEGAAMTTTTPEAGSAQDIVSMAAKDPRFSILVTGLKSTGLDQTLASAGPYTVFAPTDDAFAKLPAGTFAAIQQNPELLRSILLYHVAQGRVVAADITGETTVQTVDGDPLTITSENGTLMINNSAKAVQTTVEGSNGVIYAIDNVLLPPDIQLPSVQ